MQKDIREGMSPNYVEPYAYRQNATETFDDMDHPSSALATRKGFNLQKTYGRARKGWPSMKTAPIEEDMGGVANTANLSTNASIGDHTPQNALAVRTLQSRGLGDAERGAMGNEWDSAYASLSEASAELQELVQVIKLR